MIFKIDIVDNADLLLVGWVVTNKLFQGQVAQTLRDRDAAKPRSSNFIPFSMEIIAFKNLRKAQKYK